MTVLIWVKTVCKRLSAVNKNCCYFDLDLNQKYSLSSGDLFYMLLHDSAYLSHSFQFHHNPVNILHNASELKQSHELISDF